MKQKIICQACNRIGELSRVFSIDSSKTLLATKPAFYDEYGTYHYHDGNKVTALFRCTEGHVFQLRGYDECPEGDFGGLKEFEEILDDED